MTTFGDRDRAAVVADLGVNDLGDHMSHRIEVRRGRTTRRLLGHIASAASGVLLSPLLIRGARHGGFNRTAWNCTEAKAQVSATAVTRSDWLDGRGQPGGQEVAGSIRRARCKSPGQSAAHSLGGWGRALDAFRLDAGGGRTRRPSCGAFLATGISPITGSLLCRADGQALRVSRRRWYSKRWRSLRPRGGSGDDGHG